MSKKYEICLEWPQFEEYFLEDYTLKTVKKYKECYNECYELPGQVCINYWYGDYEDGKSNIFWTFSGHEERIHNLKYTSSSCFAMYWSSLTDDIEEDDEENEKDKETCTARCENPGTVTITDQNGKECLVCKDCHDCFKKIEGYMAEQKAFEAEEETCVKCKETKTEDWYYNTTDVKNAPVCEDCRDKDEAEEAEEEENDGFICEGCKETKEPDGLEVSCDECGKDHGCSECNGTWTVRERHFCTDCNTDHGCEMFCCEECGNDGLENDDTCYAMDGTFCNEGCLQNYIDLMREEAEKKVNLTVGA